jgi:putative transposase
MKRARFSEEQIIAILKEAESGVKATELCRRHGISDATFYVWRSKYGGLEVSEMRRLRQLEEENRRLKPIVADQALDLGCSRTYWQKTVTARGEAAAGGGSNDYA